MLTKFKNSRTAYLYNLHDDKAFGRVVMLSGAAISSVIAWLTGSLFYTSFLMIYGIDLINISIISFVPYIASCFSIFSPLILERFPRRRWVLAISRVAYYTLNLLAITVMPMLVHSPDGRIIWFVILTLAANIVSTLFNSGYSVWHVNFIPDDVRAEYFATSATVSNFLGCGAALASGLIADALSASPYKDTIVILFRYIAYGLGLLEVFLYTRPVEYPYAKSANRPRLADIITKPIAHRKFALTMLVIFLWTFIINIPTGALNYYLINDVGVQYTFIYVINMLYPFILLALTPYSNRLLRRWGWFKTFAISSLVLAPTTLMYSCVTARTYLWLLPIVRILQHVIGVANNVSYANLPFINLPDTDQTNYISFQTLITNLAIFLGMLTGTAFIGAFPDILLPIGGLTFNNVQILMWMQAAGQFVVPLLVLAMINKLSPNAN